MELTLRNQIKTQQRKIEPTSHRGHSSDKRRSRRRNRNGVRMSGQPKRVGGPQPTLKARNPNLRVLQQSRVGSSKRWRHGFGLDEEFLRCARVSEWTQKEKQSTLWGGDRSRGRNGHWLRMCFWLNGCWCKGKERIYNFECLYFIRCLFRANVRLHVPITRTFRHLAGNIVAQPHARSQLAAFKTEYLCKSFQLWSARQFFSFSLFFSLFFSFSFFCLFIPFVLLFFFLFDLTKTIEF